MIEIGNKNERIRNKDKWNYFHHMPILQLVGDNNCLLLLHMAKRFICLEETKERINEFDIGYMINSDLDVNKAFREQVDKCMNNMFGALTQNFIKNTRYKSNTSVLSLVMFHETRGLTPKKYFIVLSCVMYTIIDNYVCIDYLACQ